MALAPPLSASRGQPTAPPVLTETVPLNVWPCAQVPISEQWSEAGYATGSPVYSAVLFPELARRIVATYTSPGDVVVEAAAGSGVAAVEAARLHRRAVAVPPTEELATLATANVRRIVRRPELVTVLCGDPEALTEVAAGSVGHTSLVVLALPRRRPEASRLRWDTAAVIRGAHALLTPGGFLAVVSRVAHLGGEFIDPSATLVRLADAAGLVYLQHVVALTASIRDGELIAAGQAMARGERHVVTHTDVQVFRRLPRDV